MMISGTEVSAGLLFFFSLKAIFFLLLQFPFRVLFFLSALLLATVMSRTFYRISSFFSLLFSNSHKKANSMQRCKSRRFTLLDRYQEF